MESKNFPLSAILSLSTGVVFTEFNKIHELAEWLMGYPIWTHEFASKDLFTKFRSRILEQYPQLSTETGDDIDKTNWKSYLEDCEFVFGKELNIIQGNEDRTTSPLEILQEIAGDKPVIVIIKD